MPGGFLSWPTCRGQERVLEPATGHLGYVNAGHNPPYLRRADGPLEPLPPTRLPEALVGHGEWTSRTLVLAPGDLLPVFSDGIPEAWNAFEDEYGEERLQEVLRRNHARPGGAA